MGDLKEFLNPLKKSALIRLIRGAYNRWILRRAGRELWFLPFYPVQEFSAPFPYLAGVFFNSAEKRDFFAEKHSCNSAEMC